MRKELRVSVDHIDLAGAAAGHHLEQLIKIGMIGVRNQFLRSDPGTRIIERCPT